MVLALFFWEGYTVMTFLGVVYFNVLFVLIAVLLHTLCRVSWLFPYEYRCRYCGRPWSAHGEGEF